MQATFSMSKALCATALICSLNAFAANPGPFGDDDSDPTLIANGTYILREANAGGVNAGPIGKLKSDLPLGPGDNYLQMRVTDSGPEGFSATITTQLGSVTYDPFPPAPSPRSYQYKKDLFGGNGHCGFSYHTPDFKSAVNDYRLAPDDCLANSSPKAVTVMPVIVLYEANNTFGTVWATEVGPN